MPESVVKQYRLGCMLLFILFLLGGRGWLDNKVKFSSEVEFGRDRVNSGFNRAIGNFDFYRSNKLHIHLNYYSEGK